MGILHTTSSFWGSQPPESPSPPFCHPQLRAAAKTFKQSLEGVLKLASHGRLLYVLHGYRTKETFKAWEPVQWEYIMVELLGEGGAQDL